VGRQDWPCGRRACARDLKYRWGNDSPEAKRGGEKISARSSTIEAKYLSEGSCGDSGKIAKAQSWKIREMAVAASRPAILGLRAWTSSWSPTAKSESLSTK